MARQGKPERRGRMLRPPKPIFKRPWKHGLFSLPSESVPSWDGLPPSYILLFPKYTLQFGGTVYIIYFANFVKNDSKSRTLFSLRNGWTISGLPSTKQRYPFCVFPPLLSSIFWERRKQRDKMESCKITDSMGGWGEIPGLFFTAQTSLSRSGRRP